MEPDRYIARLDLSSHFESFRKATEFVLSHNCPSITIEGSIHQFKVYSYLNQRAFSSQVHPNIRDQIWKCPYSLLVGEFDKEFFKQFQPIDQSRWIEAPLDKMLMRYKFVSKDDKDTGLQLYLLPATVNPQNKQVVYHCIIENHRTGEVQNRPISEQELQEKYNILPRHWDSGEIYQRVCNQTLKTNGVIVGTTTQEIFVTPQQFYEVLFSAIASKIEPHVLHTINHLVVSTEFGVLLFTKVGQDEVFSDRSSN